MAQEYEKHRPGIDQAPSGLNWRPEIPLSEGLQRTAAWFEATLSDTSDFERRQTKAQERAAALAVGR